ncbi:MAG: glycoside hydrolase family 3 protein, partial [Flavobacteriaceae bacterium]
MKPLILKIAKVLLVVLALICVGAGLIYYNAVNYDMYELKRDKEVLMGDLNADEFARKMVSEMSFEEKVDQMYGESYSSIAKLGINFLVEKRFPHVYVGGNERLNLPPWVLSDGPRGARVMDHEVRAVTTFPVAMARGASWNKDLEYQVHDVIATEMRANKVNYAATPCINLLRHPAWGRAQETYGEDPYLLGVFGVAAVQAIESHHVMACPKHFALNSIENSRFVVDVELDERTLREVYLPHFKKTIQEGKPASLMSAYNKVRGEYSGNNKELLTTILREEWGFEGFISSDWISGTYDGPASVDAGLNVEMPFQDAYSYEALQNGIDQGKISEAQIDELVYQSLKTRIPYAVASDKMDYGLDQILKPESIALARQAAVESMVLLKNDEVLPFESKKEQTVLVLGALANMENTGDHGSSDSTPPYVITPLQGIESLMEQTGASVIYDDGSDLERASKLAKEADQVIVVVGYTAEEEGEYILVNREDIEASAKAGHLIGKKGLGGDRDHLSLLKRDEDLILAAGTVNPKSVVVYIGGSGIEMEAWRSKVPAILFAWYGGMEGGNALADILYGNESPSGKLPFSIAKKES